MPKSLLGRLFGHIGKSAEANGLQVTVLDNGVVVATHRDASEGKVLTTVFSKVGSRHETEANSGISHFLEHMAFKGTTTRNPKDIAFEIEALGGDVNAATSNNYTAYVVDGLPEHYTASLDILADVILNSTLPREEIIREKNVVVEEIYQYADQIKSVAMDALMETAYPNQPLGRKILGKEETVRAFTQEILAEYMKTHYHASNLFVIAIGNISHDEFVHEVDDRFGSLASGETIEVAPAEYVGGLKLVPDSRHSQAQIRLALPAPGKYDAEYAAYKMLSIVLSGGMSAPLFQKVREEAALCYAVGSMLRGQPDTSLFILAGSASSKNVKEFLIKSLAELQKVAAGEIEDGDWTRARNQIRFQLASVDDDSLDQAVNIYEQLSIQHWVETRQSQFERFNGVTKAEVIAAAKDLLASRPTLVIAGNCPKVSFAKVLKGVFPAF